MTYATTINPTQPAASSAIASAPVRNNFAAAASDINFIYSLIASMAGAGTVTSVSVATANGISGSVANSTTTPAITLSLGAITPSSVNSVAISGSSTPTLAVSGTTSVSGHNTGDQTISLGGDITGTGTSSITTTVAKIAGTTVSGTTGSNKSVFSDSPALVTPDLGTPSAIVLTNASGTASSLTSGHATALSTPRAIYGNNFDGSAALTQVIASTYGGTGNGFTKFSGPASAEKTFTIPNTSCVLVGSATAETGTSSIINMVSLTQAAYNALTPVSTTLYVIVG